MNSKLVLRFATTKQIVYEHEEKKSPKEVLALNAHIFNVLFLPFLYVCKHYTLYIY